jgi:2-polyprenyl-6-methoxyphenol hydroxylase-like FAD-dependent oxidoreductase
MIYPALPSIPFHPSKSTNTQQNWHPLIKALTEANPYTNLYPNFADDAISTWVFKDRVTLVGDAAHVHGGAFAVGGYWLWMMLLR